MRKERRKANLLLVLLFAMTIAIVSFGTLALAMTLYASGNDSAKRYAEYQSYRAAIEVSVYQYVADLCSVSVRRDLNSDWISVSDSAVYSQGLELIQETIGTEEDRLVWKVTDITEAISAAPMTDATIATSLLGSVSVEGIKEFQLKSADVPSINYESLNNVINDKGLSIFELNPIEVDVHLRVRGEILDEKLYVSGLVLNSNYEAYRNEFGKLVENVSMQIKEGEAGIDIYRK